MYTKKNMGVPIACFWTVIAACVIGIVIGSFCDLSINIALANVTELGKQAASWMLIIPNLFYAAAGACLFVGLKKKNSALAWTLLATAVFYAVSRSESGYGIAIRKLFGYEPGESSVFLYLITWLFWVALYSLEAYAVSLLLDDSNPERLVAIGAVILIAGILSGSVNSWLKSFASRPRYKYLLQTDDPGAEYRQWWQMIPYLPGGDSFKSWPSGHMTSVCIVFTLPMLTDAMKNRSTGKNIAAFCFSCAVILLCGYNRIHMTNHFLSDVCFGVLITYLLYCWMSIVFLKAMSPQDS